jgi:hypothetical protein
MPKKSLVLNVSDQKLDNTNVLLLEGNLVNFFDYHVSNDYEEFKHIAGHVIDGLLD